MIFLDAILKLLHRDEGATVAESAVALRRPFASRLQGEYAPRLGGDWNVAHQNRPVGRWFSDVYQLRNRVLHGGYIPDRHAAGAALAAADGLSTFLLDRIAHARNRYPRTALVTFDARGLERRGIFSRRMREAATTLEAERPLLVQYMDWQAAIDEARDTP